MTQDDGRRPGYPRELDAPTEAIPTSSVQAATTPLATVAPARKRRFRLPLGLELNALALMSTTGMTALFGLVFWGIAAQYPAAEVGRSSAVITTATSISSLASLAVGLLFTRFLGSTGARSMFVVAAGYGVTAGTALLLSGGYVLFFADPEVLVTDLDALLFPVIAVVLSIFVLQDWVLIGLRGARWVPIAQFAYSALKLGLLALFALTFWRDGIVTAWVVPAALAVLVVSAVLFVRVLPRRPPPAEGATALPSRRALGGLFAAEYATGATTVIVPLVVPLIVVAQLGAEANAYFALPWIVAQAVTTLLWNICSSYMVEASNDRSAEPALMFRTLKLMALVAGGGWLFLVVAAPFVLGVLGPDYAEQGTPVLRLVACALPFAVIWDLYTSTLRIRLQMARVVVLQAVVAVTVIGLAAVLAGPLGLTGVALGLLCAEVLAASIVSVPLYRIVRENRRLLREPTSARRQPVPAA
jgi:O-antigen/teichoic acid export membrane protein